MNPELVLPAAFLAGLFGSAHCLGMCGAVVVLLEGRGGRGQWPRRVLYHAGRLGFYGLLGAAAGAGGALLTQAAGLEAGLTALRCSAALLVVALGLGLLTGRRTLGFLEQAGAALWRRLAPMTRYVLPATTPERAVAAGFLWGALPCGLVYGATAIAATAGTPVGGALVMAAFWAGTAPALLVAGTSAARLRRVRGNPLLRRLAGAVLVAVGGISLALPLLQASGEAPHAWHQAGVPASDRGFPQE